MAGDITRTATIKFEADTSAAQARIQQLAQSLQSAINFGVESSGVTVIDKQLQAATSDAIKLQAQLSQAVNVNTGKLDLTKFTQSLKTGQTSLQQYQQSLSQLGSSGQAAFAALARSIATAEAPMQRVSNVLAQMGTTLKNTIKWNISASIINGFVSSIQQAFSYAERLNDSLNRIQIVTGESTAQMAKFAQEANKSAQLLSTTTRQYTDAALIFYQQGLNDSQVKARTDAVIKMANVTGDASKEVSNYMTAIWNNFDNGASSLESFEDKIVSLGATTASSSAEIAAGLEKFAAVGNTIGLSFDYAAAALATVVAETRQSADTVGTAFRTLFSRLQGLKLGETLEDGTSLNKYSAALATVGVQIQDASGQLKNMDTILTDLAGNWDNLTQAQKVALAQTVGGARQYTTLISLMENWDQFQKNLATEAGSEGALQKQADTYAQSWEAAKDRVTASMESIYSSLINDKFMINLNNGLAKALSGVNALIKGMGGMSGLMSRIGAVALTVFEKQIAASLRNLNTNLELMTKKGQERMRQIQIETTNMMGKMGGYGAGGSISANAYSQEAQAQNLILQNMNKMDSIEQARAQTLQNIIQTRSDENAKLGETISQLTDLQNKQSNAAERTAADISKMSEQLKSITMNDGATNGVQMFNQIKQEMVDLQSAFADQDVIKRFLDSFNGADNAVGRLEALKAKMAELSTEGGPRAEQAMRAVGHILDNLAAKSMTTERAVEAITKVLNNKLSGAMDDAAKHSDAFNVKIDSLIQKANELGNTTIASYLTTLKAQFNGATASTEELAKAMVKASNNELTMQQAMGMLKALMGEVGVKTLDTSQKIVKFGQILTTISSAINQVAGMIDIWKDKDASFGKKLLTTITTIGMLLPLIVRLKTNIMELGISNLKAAAETGSLSAAQSLEAITATGAAGATKAFGIALKNAIPIVGWIITALTILIGILTAVWNQMDHRSNFQKLQDLNKEIQDLQTELDNTVTKIEEMWDAFNNYEDAIEALGKLKEGTDEWATALLGVKDTQDAMITNWPVLKDIIEHPENYNLSPDEIFDERGIVRKEVRDIAATRQNQVLSSSAILQNGAINSKQQEKIKLADTTMIEAAADYVRGVEGFDYGTHEADGSYNENVSSTPWMQYLAPIIATSPNTRAWATMDTIMGARNDRIIDNDTYAEISSQFLQKGFIDPLEQYLKSYNPIEEMAWDQVYGEILPRIFEGIDADLWSTNGQFDLNKVLKRDDLAQLLFSSFTDSTSDTYIGKILPDIIDAKELYQSEGAGKLLGGDLPYFNVDDAFFEHLAGGKLPEDFDDNPSIIVNSPYGELTLTRKPKSGLFGGHWNEVRFANGEDTTENRRAVNADWLAFNNYDTNDWMPRWYKDGIETDNWRLQSAEQAVAAYGDRQEAESDVVGQAGLGNLARLSITGKSSTNATGNKVLGAVMSQLLGPGYNNLAAITDTSGEALFISPEKIEQNLNSPAFWKQIFPGQNVSFDTKSNKYKVTTPGVEDEEDQVTEYTREEFQNLAQQAVFFTGSAKIGTANGHDISSTLIALGVDPEVAAGIEILSDTSSKGLTISQAKAINQSQYGQDIIAATGAKISDDDLKIYRTLPEYARNNYNLSTLDLLLNPNNGRTMRRLLFNGAELPEEVVRTALNTPNYDYSLLLGEEGIQNNEEAASIIQQKIARTSRGKVSTYRNEGMLDTSLDISVVEGLTSKNGAKQSQLDILTDLGLLTPDLQSQYFRKVGVSGSNNEGMFKFRNAELQADFVTNKLMPALDKFQSVSQAVMGTMVDSEGKLIEGQESLKVYNGKSDKDWQTYVDKHSAQLRGIYGANLSDKELYQLDPSEVNSVIERYQDQSIDDIAASWIPMMGLAAAKYFSSPEVAAGYAESMVQAQASLYDTTLDDSTIAQIIAAKTDENTWQEAYDSVIQDNNFIAGMNGFLTHVTTKAALDNVHELASLSVDKMNGVEGTRELDSTEQQTLTNIHQDLAGITGLEKTDNEWNEWMVQHQDFINALYEGDEAELETIMSEEDFELGEGIDTEGIKNWARTMAVKHAETAEEKVTEALQEAIKTAVSGDYSKLTLKQRMQQRDLVADENGHTEAALASQDLVDSEKHEITETGIAFLTARGKYNPLQSYEELQTALWEEIVNEANESIAEMQPSELFKNVENDNIRNATIKMWNAYVTAMENQVSAESVTKFVSLARTFADLGYKNGDELVAQTMEASGEYADAMLEVMASASWGTGTTTWTDISRWAADKGIPSEIINAQREFWMPYLADRYDNTVESVLSDANNGFSNIDSRSLKTANDMFHYDKGTALEGRIRYDRVREYARNQEWLNNDNLLTESGIKALQGVGYDTRSVKVGQYMTTQMVEAIVDGMEQAEEDLTPEALAAKLPAVLKNPAEFILAAIEETNGTLTTEDATKVTSLLSNARQYGGAKGVDTLSQIVTDAVAAGNDINDVINALNNLDWGNITSADELEDQLSRAGLNTEGLSADLEGLVTAMQNAAIATTALADALNQYSNASSIANGIMKDGTITAEQAAAMDTNMGRGYVDNLFEQRADGKMVLRDNTEENRLRVANGYLQASENNLYETQTREAGVASDFAYTQGLVGMNEYGIHSAAYANGGTLESAQFVVGRARNSGFTGTTADKLEDIELGLNSDVASVRETALLSLQELQQTDQEFADWMQLNVDNAKSDALRAGEAGVGQDELTASGIFTETKATNLNELESQADQVTKLTGTQGESTEAYNEALSELASGYETCVKELQDYQEALESGNEEQITATKRALKAKMAQEDYAKEMTRSSKAVQDSVKNMKKMEDEYGDVAKGMVEYRGELGKVQKEVNKLFGTNVTEDFVRDHLDDINAMAEGDEEAFQRVQDAVEDEYGPLHIEVDDSEALNALGDVLNLADYVDGMPDLEINVNGYADMDQLVQDIAMALAQAQGLLDANGNIMASEAGNIAAQVSGVLSEAMDGYTVSVEPAGTQSIQVGEDSVTTWSKTGSTTLNAGANADGSQRTVFADNATAQTRVTPVMEDRPVFTTKVEKDGGYDSNPYKGTSSASPHGGGCFEAGTLITTYNGYKNIEDIQVGDIVLSYNEKLQRNEYSQVLETMIHVVVDNIYTLHIKDDDLVVTGIHRFYVKRMGRTMWVAAANLHVNDIVLFANGTWHLIEAIDIEYKATVVYNFEVSGNHNYYVGKNRILAHNKGGGGGGGGRRAETGDKKRKEQRYITNTNQLEDIQDKLDKINKAESRSYGRNRIKQMQDKAKALKELAAKQRDLYNEAVAYQKQDAEALKKDSFAKAAGIKFEFDENGTILNRDEIEQKMVDYYNSFTKGTKNKDGEYELKSGVTKEKWKEVQEGFSDLQELLDKYDESQDKVKEYHQAILDSINEEYDNLVEMANYKVEIQVDVSDEALKILDFMLAKIEDDAYKAADAIAIMGQQAWEAQAQNRINDNGIRDILKIHNGETQYADADGNLHTTTNINKDIGIDKLMNGDAEAWGKLMSLEKEFTQDEVDALQGFIDAKIEHAQNLMELQKDVYAKVSEVFDKGTEDMDRLINKMDHLRTITSSYLNIVDLVGKKHLGITNDFLDEMQLSGVDQDINKVSASLTKLNTQRKMLSNFRNQFGGNTQTLRAAATADEKAEREAMAQRMERMGASAEAVAQVRASIASDQVMQLTQRDKDLITEEINHMEDEIQASTEDFHSAWEEAITSIADFYTVQIGRAIEDASDKLAGELGSLDELADKFAKTQEVNDLYVEDFEKIYEMSKLNRDILKSIDETDNVKAKQRLVEYQAELNQLEEDRAQMSEYEIENARRRYELLLAELALEESKNAKSQVQMARNDLGEWSYVYTADESAVEEAEQNYEDKLYAMQRANADYINSLQENIVDLQQRMVEEIEAIRIEDYASAEEYWNAINDIKEHYSTLMDGNMEQMDIVFNEQTRLYEEDWATYSEMTGYKISADEDYIDKWNETAISKLTGFKTMEEYHRNFNDTTDELLKQCNESYEIWEDKVKETMEAAGTTMDDFTEQMNTDVGEMTSQSGELASSMETTGATIVQAFDDMTEALSNWQAEYSKSIEEMLEKNEALAKSFNNLLKEWSGYNEATGLDDSSGEGEGTEGSTEEIEESTEEPAAEPMPEERRESPEAKTRRLKKGIAAAIWGYRGGAGWGHGNSSRKLTSGTRYRRFKEKGLIPDKVQQQINRYSGWSRGRMLDDAGLSYSDLKKYTYPHFAFDTGGYTGDWDGTDGRFALLHSKEIVLNKEDTANFLAGIEILRDITKAIDLNAMASAGYMAKIANAPTIGGLGTTLEQEVHITAEFPNATDRNEIEAAFGDIINLASQYANRQQ